MHLKGGFYMRPRFDMHLQWCSWTRLNHLDLLYRREASGERGGGRGVRGRGFGHIQVRGTVGGQQHRVIHI
jgi:hypothetical protein